MPKRCTSNQAQKDCIDEVSDYDDAYDEERTIHANAHASQAMSETMEAAM